MKREAVMHEWFGDLKKIIDTPPGLAITAFLCSSVAGLAELLRTNQRLYPRNVLAAMLHSACWGAAVAMVLLKYVEGNFIILGISIMSGIGGATATDFIVELIKKGLGVSITFRRGGDSNDRPTRDS